MGYVSMREYQSFRELFVEDEVEGIILLISYSLQRGGSIRGDVRKFLKRMVGKAPDSLVKMVEKVHEISLPVLSISNNEMEEMVKDEVALEKNIKTTYRLLAKQFTWTPEEISQMSPAQIFISTTGGPNCDGTMKQSWGEFAANRDRGKI